MEWQKFMFTLSFLVFIKRMLANSVDPDHMPQNMVADQGLHSLHTEIYVKIVTLATDFP